MCITDSLFKVEFVFLQWENIEIMLIDKAFTGK